MASNGSVPNHGKQNAPSQSQSPSHINTSDVGRAVTDAVHERLRQDFVYCDSCNVKFFGNGVSIHNHFNRSHISNAFCSYCPGKVFHYYKMKEDGVKSEKIYYHRCRDWLSK